MLRNLLLAASMASRRKGTTSSVIDIGPSFPWDIMPCTRSTSDLAQPHSFVVNYMVRSAKQTSGQRRRLTWNVAGGERPRAYMTGTKDTELKIRRIQ